MIAGNRNGLVNIGFRSRCHWSFAGDVIKMQRLTIVAILSLTLSYVGCASQPRFTWQKEGATRESFHVDQSACQKQVRDQLAAEGDFSSPVSRTATAELQLRTQSRADELMVQCMESAGYKRAPTE